jgi:hypothetical protein
MRFLKIILILIYLVPDRETVGEEDPVLWGKK